MDLKPFQLSVNMPYFPDSAHHIYNISGKWIRFPDKSKIRNIAMGGVTKKP